MEVAENIAIMLSDIASFFETCENVVHGRGTDMKDFGETTSRAVPSFVGKSFGVGKTVNICEDSDVGKGEIHVLQHP